MTIQEKVAAVAALFTGIEYRFMNWAQLNVEVDHVERPTICYILPPSGELTPTRSGALWKDAPETQFAFLTPTDFDFDGALNDEKIEIMKNLAKQFIKALNESGEFELIDGEALPYQVAYDVLDDNLTGIILTVRLTERIGSPLCEVDYNFGNPEQPEEPEDPEPDNND